MSNHTGYRADIDGLRALAVTSVVAFHAHLPIVTGGFVGVDVFFVISGYLITQLLLREAARTGTVNLAEFYARRIRRLLPALAVVLVAVFLAGYFLLLPLVEQPKLARSGLWTAAYVSNIYFKLNAGDYFAGPAEEQPLLHTWSLAVEEQYYLIWPLLVLAISYCARRLGVDLRRALLCALVPLTLTSLALCIRWTTTSPEAAFYYLPARAWELGVGAILAIVVEGRQAKRPAIGNALFVVGIGLLGVAFFALDRASHFPGVAAMLPVFGTAACIAAGTLGSHLSMTVLGNRACVAVGKLSYSWYLWHWPLLAIASVRGLNEPDLERDLALAIVALGLAALTLRFVENPVRHAKPGPFARRWPTIIVGLVASVLLALAALTLQWAAGRQAREPRYAGLAATRNDVSPLRDRCHIAESLGPRTECTLPGTDPAREIVVWGDSHAERMLAAVAEFGRTRSIPVVQRTSTACPPLLGVVPSNNAHQPSARCQKFNDAVLAELAESVRGGKQPTVVLVGRWPNYTDTISPARVRTRTLFGRDGATGTPLELLESGLERTLAALEKLKIRTIVAASQPEFAHSPPECSLRAPERCAVVREAAERYREPAHAAVQRVLTRHPATAQLVDAFAALCDGTRCSPVLDGVVAYSDPHHMTFSGAARLAHFFAPQLSWATSPAAP